jgi:hypothetical protein
VTVFGPTDTWPTHQKPYWNKALKQAHDAGWSLKYLDAPHRFGIVSCPAGEHVFDVDKTARGAETRANEVPKKIRSCQHGAAQSESKMEARRARCAQLLDRAEELLDGVERDLPLAEAKLAATAELDRLELILATAGANVDEAMAEQDSALAAAIEVEVDEAPQLGHIGHSLSEAAESVAKATDVAGAIRRPGIVKAIADRAKTANDRVATLRARLAALQEQI